MFLRRGIGDGMNKMNRIFRPPEKEDVILFILFILSKIFSLFY